MSTPSIELNSQQRAHYSKLPIGHRPIVDRARGLFTDLIRTNDLEAFEKEIFPLYKEYERLLAPLDPSAPEPYYPLLDCFGLGPCDLSGLAAWIFDAFMISGRRDKAWDFLCGQRDYRCSSPSLSIPGLINLRLLSPDRPIEAEELPSVYLARNRIGPSDQRQALSLAAGSLITRFERARGFSFTGYFFTRWLLRDADAYAPFSDVIRAEAAYERFSEVDDLAELDLRVLMNVRKMAVDPFGEALVSHGRVAPYVWYSCPEFDAVFSIILDSLMALAESALKPGEDGSGPASDLLSSYPTPFDFEDKSAYAWTEDEILSDVSSYATDYVFRQAQSMVSAIGATRWANSLAESEKTDLITRLIKAKNGRALSNLLSTGSVNSLDDFSELLSRASEVDAGVEILSVLLSSQHQFCQTDGARAPGAIPEL